MLKKLSLAIIFCIIFFGFFYSAEAAKALTTPHIVIEGEVWLLDIESGKRLFLLPDTYYAAIKNMDENFYYVTFNGVEGKVEKQLVSTVGYHTQAAGTMQELKVHPQYGDFVTIALKTSMDSAGEDIHLPVNDSFIFLGLYPLSEMWYCVMYQDKIGYIKAQRTTVPEMQIPEFAPEQPNGEDKGQPSGNDKKEKSFFKKESTLRIIIIAGLSVPAVVLIALLFKPRKTKRGRYYYEE
ncbi:MAG TPA: hypothetical protein GXZ92_01220 [Clostridiales bacterium]|jgi:hypothetical protein|nr:hypothetical protein [Clostridiales bacterium]